VKQAIQLTSCISICEQISNSLDMSNIFSESMPEKVEVYLKDLNTLHNTITLIKSNNENTSLLVTANNILHTTMCCTWGYYLLVMSENGGAKESKLFRAMLKWGEPNFGVLNTFFKP